MTLAIIYSTMSRLGAKDKNAFAHRFCNSLLISGIKKHVCISTIHDWSIDRRKNPCKFAFFDHFSIHFIRKCQEMLYWRISQRNSMIHVIPNRQRANVQMERQRETVLVKQKKNKKNWNSLQSILLHWFAF